MSTYFVTVRVTNHSPGKRVKVRGGVKTLSAELRKSAKLLSADFTEASRNSKKNLYGVLKIDIMSVIDVNENEHTSR